MRFMLRSCPQASESRAARVSGTMELSKATSPIGGACDADPPGYCSVGVVRPTGTTLTYEGCIIGCIIGHFPVKVIHRFPRVIHSGI